MADIWELLRSLDEKPIVQSQDLEEYDFHDALVKFDREVSRLRMREWAIHIKRQYEREIIQNALDQKSHSPNIKERTQANIIWHAFCYPLVRRESDEELFDRFVICDEKTSCTVFDLEEKKLVPRIVPSPLGEKMVYDRYLGDFRKRNLTDDFRDVKMEKEILENNLSFLDKDEMSGEYSLYASHIDE